MRKQTRRRLAALALSAALLGAALPLSAQAATFRDVPAGAWSADAGSALASPPPAAPAAPPGKRRAGVPSP